MIFLLLRGAIRHIDFHEFTELVRAGRVPEDALLCGDALTGGQTVRAGELRTYALLRGRPPPPPRAFPREPGTPNLTQTLDRIRWEPSVPAWPDLDHR